MRLKKMLVHTTRNQPPKRLIRITIKSSFPEDSHNVSTFPQQQVRIIAAPIANPSLDGTPSRALIVREMLKRTAIPTSTYPASTNASPMGGTLILAPKMASSLLPPSSGLSETNGSNSNDKTNDSEEACLAVVSKQIDDDERKSDFVTKDLKQTSIFDWTVSSADVKHRLPVQDNKSHPYIGAEATQLAELGYIHAEKIVVDDSGTIADIFILPDECDQVDDDSDSLTQSHILLKSTDLDEEWELIDCN